jgi:hypothetical protein
VTVPWFNKISGVVIEASFHFYFLDFSEPQLKNIKGVQMMRQGFKKMHHLVAF